MLPRARISMGCRTRVGSPVRLASLWWSSALLFEAERAAAQRSSTRWLVGPKLVWTA